MAGSTQVELDTLFAKLRDPALGAKVLSIEPQIWDAWTHSGTDAENEQLAKATASMNVGAFEQADKQLTAMVATSPNYPEAWNKRATLYFLMGRMDESLKDITTTLDLEPRHFGALFAFKEALSINPNMPGPALAVKQLEKLVPEL